MRGTEKMNKKLMVSGPTKYIQIYTKRAQSSDIVFINLSSQRSIQEKRN